MNVTTIPVGSTGQSLEGVEPNVGVREFVCLTDPDDTVGVAKVVSSQPISFYGLPVWLQGSPNVNVTNNPAVSVSAMPPVSLTGTSQVFGTVSTQVVSSIPFFVVQSSAPWTMTMSTGTTMVSVVSSVVHVVTVQGTSSVIVLSAPPPTSSSGAKTSVSASTASKTVLAANTGRRGATIWNDSVASMFLDESGGTASSDSFTAKLLSQQGYVVDAGYTGLITGVWSSTTGNARVTEFT